MLEKQINETVEYIRSKIGTVPEAAIVLGSGLGGGERGHSALYPRYSLQLSLPAI